MHSILLRLLSSFAGGMIGTASLLVVYFIFLMILPKGADNSTGKAMIVFMIFTGTMVTAIASNALISLSNPSKYSRKGQSLMQTFFANTALLVMSLPFYFFFESVNELSLTYILFSVYISNIIMECYASRGQFILTGLYGSTMGVFLASMAFLQLIGTLGDYTIMFFFIIPIINLMITISIIVTEFIAGELFEILKKNPLDINSENA